MRSFIFIGIFSMLTIHAWAGCETSTLQIHTDLHRPIKVYVDGRTGDNPPTVGVTVNGITPGMHHIKVVEVYRNRYGENVHRTVYNGDIDVRPSVYIDARVDEGRGISLHNTKVSCDQQYNAPANNYQQPANTSNNTAPTPPASQPAAAVPEPIPAHLSDADFKKIVKTITATKYETKKLDTLNTLITGNDFSTDQVRQLMNLFSFESNKLAVAKLLYDHTVDTKNYGTLSANFNFADNKEAFKKFLAGR
jgi:hypothetical protein